MTYELKALLEFKSIQNYLNGSIGSKKSKISENLTLEQKLKEVNTSQYLRGIALFFDYSKTFRAPNDIIAYFEKNRASTESMNLLKKEVQSFISWLKTQNYSDSTIVSYQAQVRGFLKHNDIRFTFKNYKPKTEKKSEQRKIGFFYEEQKSFAIRVKEFINDMDLRVLVEIAHSTGLGFKEIADLTFGTLRRIIDTENEYGILNADREKTSIEFMNYIRPDLKPTIKGYLVLNSDKNDNDKIFGETDKAYSSLSRKFNTVYDKCIEAYFPKLLDIKTKKDNLKRLFTIHTYRSVFISAGTKLRIPEAHINIMVAHTQKEINAESYLSISEDLLNDYILIENELFGNKSNKSEDQLKKEFLEDLFNLMTNSGKRKALFRKYEEDKTIDVDYEIKMAMFLETFKNNIVKEVEEKVMSKVMENVKERISKIPLKELLSSL